MDFSVFFMILTLIAGCYSIDEIEIVTGSRFQVFSNFHSCLVNVTFNTEESFDKCHGTKFCLDSLFSSSKLFLSTKNELKVKLDLEKDLVIVKTECHAMFSTGLPNVHCQLHEMEPCLNIPPMLLCDRLKKVTYCFGPYNSNCTQRLFPSILRRISLGMWETLKCHDSKRSSNLRSDDGGFWDDFVGVRYSPSTLFTYSTPNVYPTTDDDDDDHDDDYKDRRYRTNYTSGRDMEHENETVEGRQMEHWVNKSSLMEGLNYHKNDTNHGNSTEFKRSWEHPNATEHGLGMGNLHGNSTEFGRSWEHPNATEHGLGMGNLTILSRDGKHENVTMMGRDGEHLNCTKHGRCAGRKNSTEIGRHMKDVNITIYEDDIIFVDRSFESSETNVSGKRHLVDPLVFNATGRNLLSINENSTNESSSASSSHWSNPTERSFLGGLFDTNSSLLGMFNHPKVKDYTDIEEETTSSTVNYTLKPFSPRFNWFGNHTVKESTPGLKARQFETTSVKENATAANPSSVGLTLTISNSLIVTLLFIVYLAL